MLNIEQHPISPTPYKNAHSSFCFFSVFSSFGASSSPELATIAHALSLLLISLSPEINPYLDTAFLPYTEQVDLPLYA